MKSLMLAAFVIPGWVALGVAETFPPLQGGVAPQTFEAMWAGFDPRAEPLEVEVLKEWEQDGVDLKVLRFRVGVFKGRKAMMAAVYGRPKDGSRLPGLVQIHGGGQYADYLAPLTNAKRGYATISIAWAGRLSAPGYAVGPDIVKLFWEDRTNDPNYRITTDWGALDGYHAPSRDKKTVFPSADPNAWTLDAVESPRNSPWFLCAVAARRALTFLEQQPEVDGDRLGVYGHSMGGKLTVMAAAADARVKAAAPSCGGISDRDNRSALFRATLGDDVQLSHLSCPVFFLSPANDFHGRINDLPRAAGEIKSKQWRFTCAPHHNHQDTAAYEVATELWFDQVLKGSFQAPATPVGRLSLQTEAGVPVFAVTPDASWPIASVDVFYTQQGRDQLPDDRENTIARFWHHAGAKQSGETWTAGLTALDAARPLWVYANVLYRLDAPVSGAGYYYAAYTSDRFNLSSLMAMVTADDLKAAGVRTTLQTSLLIESFEGDWEKEWFTYKPADWARSTHKPYCDRWKAPGGARLQIEVLALEPNKMVVGLDQSAAEVDVRGGPERQVVTLSAADFHSATGKARGDWTGIKELRLLAKDRLSEKVDGKDVVLELGAPWKGGPPKFRNLQWVVAD